MHPRLSSSRATLLAFVAAAVSALAACGSETPPYDELPLRDALSASPEILAELPDDARLDLAQRLAGEHAGGGDEEATARTDVPSAVALVRGADEAREAEGKDVIVLGSIEPGGEGFVVRELGLEGALDPASLDPSSFDRRDVDERTRLLEDTALRGQAGAVVAALARGAEAEEIVRVTGWPAGVIVAEKKVYVNASWLVAMSALEPKEPPAPALAPALPMGKKGSGLAPQSIDGNPYDLPLSLEQCASAVRDKCTCTALSTCSHEPADPTFASATEECTWVNLDPVNAEALCVLALMSVFNVAKCVEEGSFSCAEPPVESRSRALEVLLTPMCREHLDACLSTGNPASTSGGSSGGSCNNNNDCSPDCDSDCGDCNNNNSNCNSSNSNCGGCSDSSCSNCKSCRVARAHPSEPAHGGGWGDILLFLSPVAYMARRLRRRS